MTSFLGTTAAGGYANTGHKLVFSSTFADEQADEDTPPRPLSAEFMAFVTSFSQTFASSWTSEAVYGRIDPIGTFQGNQRTISVGWDVPAGSPKEAAASSLQFATLSQLLYPSYTGGDTAAMGNALTLAKPPLIKLKYANLISTVNGDPLLGWINNVSWTPALDMGMFQAGDKLYPKVVSLQIDFSVLHEGEMGWEDGAWKGGATFPFGG